VNLPRLSPRPSDRCRVFAGGDHGQGGAPGAKRGRTTLTVIFRGDRMPGARRTARPLRLARSPWFVTAGTSCRAGAGEPTRRQWPAPGTFQCRGSGPGCRPPSGGSPSPTPHPLTMGTPARPTLPLGDFRAPAQLRAGGRMGWRAGGVPLKAVEKVVTRASSSPTGAQVGMVYCRMSVSPGMIEIISRTGRLSAV
jgi:hypothetical protein